MSKVVFLFAFVFAFGACNSNDEVLKETHYNGYAQGTTFHLSFLYEEEEPQNMDQALDSIFQAIDRSMSTYKANSVISRLNQGDTVQLDEHFQKVYQKSLEVYEATNGYFDPSVGKLVNFWGFGPDAQRSNDSSAVDSLKQFVGFSKLPSLSDPWYLEPGFTLDFNAIAQGYTVDVIAEYFQDLGIQNYMIEVGGELRCLGQNLKGEAWRIGVDKPTEEIDQQYRFQFILAMDSLSLATSGNYRKYWIDSISGQRYAHTIDPLNGFPVKNKLLSASVLAGSCMEADAYATAFMSMGLRKSMDFIQKKKGELEVYLIYIDKKGHWAIFQSPGFEARILD